MTKETIQQRLRQGWRLVGHPNRNAPFIFVHDRYEGWTDNIDARTARDLIENGTVLERGKGFYIANTR